MGSHTRIELRCFIYFPKEKVLGAFLIFVDVTNEDIFDVRGKEIKVYSSCFLLTFTRDLSSDFMIGLHSFRYDRCFHSPELIQELIPSRDAQTHT